MKGICKASVILNGPMSILAVTYKRAGTKLGGAESLVD